VAFVPSICADDVASFLTNIVKNNQHLEAYA